MAHDVFISYAIEDQRVADAVCEALEEGGIRCWYAPRNVPYAVDYEEAIIDAISQSKLMLLILSAHANNSAHVKREVQNACREEPQIPVLPFQIADVPLSKSFRYYIGSVQWLVASTPPLEAHLQKLVNYVQERLPQSEQDEDSETQRDEPAQAESVEKDEEEASRLAEEALRLAEEVERRRVEEEKRLAAEAEDERQRRAAEEKRRAEEEAEQRRLAAEAAARRAAEERRLEEEERERKEAEERQRIEAEEGRRAEEERLKQEAAEATRRAEEEQQQKEEEKRRQSEAVEIKQRQEEEKRQEKERQAEERLASEARFRELNLAAKQKQLDESPTEISAGDMPMPVYKNKRVMLIALGALVVIVIVVAVSLTGRKKDEQQQSANQTATPTSTQQTGLTMNAPLAAEATLTPSPTPEPIPTPDKATFEKSLPAFIKNDKDMAFVIESWKTVELRDDRKFIYGDLDGDGTEDAALWFCGENMGLGQNFWCKLVAFRSIKGVLTYAASKTWNLNRWAGSYLRSITRDGKIIVAEEQQEVGDAASPIIKSQTKIVLDGNRLKEVQ